MINFIKKILKKNEDLYLKNDLFLSKLIDEQLENLFKKLIINNEKIIITYNSNYNENENYNYYYNNFFKEYKKIVVDEKEFLIIEDNFKDKLNHIHLNNTIIIGKENNSYIYIKKNSIKNGIYISEIDNEESIKIEDSLYKNIYHYLINAIGSYYHLDLEKFYNINCIQ